MTFAGRLISFFSVFTLILASVLAMNASGFASIGIFFGVIFLFPPLAFRVHQWIAPLQAGLTRLSNRGYSPWWGSHQIQMIFIAIPQLESLLRLVPGVYSAWLRLWGAKIGRNVYWTPRIEITDRSLIEVGDHVIFGHNVIIVSHVVDQKPEGQQILYCKPVRVGSNCFIGAASILGPGSSVAEGSRLNVQTILKVNEHHGS